VNIKILLDRVAAAGQLDASEREPLLRSMADEVATLVLQDNIDQNTLLTFDTHFGSGLVPALGRLIGTLEQTSGLDRELEDLPSDRELAALVAAGHGLTSPEIAVVVAYTKLGLKEALLATTVPDEAFAVPWLHDYFPAVLAGRYAAHIDQHPLRRQIIVTGLVNEMVNRGGATYAMRAAEETGAGPAEVARAFAVAMGVFDLRQIWRRIDAEEGRTPAAALTSMRFEVQRLVDRATRWLLQTRGGTLDVGGEVERFRATVESQAGRIPEWLVGVELERLDERVAELVAAGAPRALAVEVATLLDVFSLLDVVEISRRTGEAADVVGRLYFTISERYEIDRFLGRISALPRGDRWATLARSALRSDLYGALASLTLKVVRATLDGEDPAERVAWWEQLNAEGLARARATLAEIGAEDSFDLATLSVALRVLRTLALQSA
jgi:glutamate dehydrogenase